MSSFEWLTEKASNALQAISEAGTTLLNAAQTLLSDASDSSNSAAEEDVAGEALYREALDHTKPSSKPISKSLETHLSIKPLDLLTHSTLIQRTPDKPQDKPSLNPEAVLTAKSTINAVWAIAEQFSKLDVSNATGALSELIAAGKLKSCATTGLSWESEDGKLKVHKINDTSKLEDDYARLWAEIDGSWQSGRQPTDASGPTQPRDRPTVEEELSNPAEPDRSAESCRPVTVSREAVAALFEHTGVDGNGRETRITGNEGEILVQVTDADGRTITTVQKGNGVTDVRHGDERAIQAEGQTIAEGPGYRVIVKDGIRRVFLDDNRELVRTGTGAKIIDRSGDTPVEYELGQEQLTVCLRGQTLVFCSATDDLEGLTRRIREELAPGQTRMLVMKGLGVRTIFHDGTVMDVRSDRTTRIQTPDGHVFVMDNRGKLFLHRQGQNIPLDRDNLPEQISFRNGKFYICGCEINPSAVQVIAGRLTVNVGTGEQIISDDSGELRIVTNTDGSTDVHDGAHHVHNHDESGRIHIGTPGQSKGVLVNLLTNEVENDKVLDRPDATVIKASGTEIDSRGEVRFEGGRGPTLFADGSVRVDANTFIGADMTVTSGNWSASAAVESRAISVAADSTNKAGGVIAKATSGTVRWSDISALDGALGNVMSLLSCVPSSSPAYAQLIKGYQEIMKAISFATPRALAAETAQSRGITDESSLKIIQDAVENSSPAEATEQLATRRTSSSTSVQLVQNGYWLDVQSSL